MDANKELSIPILLDAAHMAFEQKDMESAERIAKKIRNRAKAENVDLNPEDVVWLSCLIGLQDK
tara:strand:- start:4264 stop:4455 length:192 start_codon:yes stop_codon:yes gene_type:complete